MELFKDTLLAAMAMLMFLLVAVAPATAVDSDSESPAAVTATSSAGNSGAEHMAMPPPPSSSSGEYYDDLSPSLRRLARAIVVQGSGYGHDNHTKRHPGGTARQLPGCDTSPSICRTTNHTLHCCGKRCVDVKTDEFHCGHCGNKCHYRHKCCGGKCVDVAYDKHNCGSCGNACKHGKCVYGMCSYSS